MNSSPVKCRGVALLLLMMLLLTASAFALLQSTPRLNSNWQAQQESGQALAAAKTALMAFAVNYADNYGHNTRGGPGRLPCPAAQRYSRPVLSCEPATVGFLPTLWKRDGKWMDIDYLERFLDRDLWYAVAEDFRYNPSYNSLNSVSADGLLSVDGRSDVVAVIIDPGAALADQRGRRPGTDVDAYLEGENADGDHHFSVSQPNANDRLVWITRDELMPLLERRVLGIVSDWLREYKRRYGRYPYASEIGDPEAKCLSGLTRGWLPMAQGDCSRPSLGEFVSETVPHDRGIRETWFGRNRWMEFVIYMTDQNCVGELALSQCDGVLDPPLALRLDDQPSEVVLISAGAPIATERQLLGQDRTNNPQRLDHYLDNPATLDANWQYQTIRRSADSNDQFLAIKPAPVQ